MSYKVININTASKPSKLHGFHMNIHVYCYGELLFIRAFSFYYNDMNYFVNSKDYNPY